MTEEKENEYDVEEGDNARWFYVTKGEEAFTVERIYYAVSDTIGDNIYGKDGELIDTIIEKEKCSNIRAAVNKYLEKEKRTVQIEVKSGTVVDVRNLPEGCNYEVIDRDISRWKEVE